MGWLACLYSFDFPPSDCELALVAQENDAKNPTKSPRESLGRAGEVCTPAQQRAQKWQIAGGRETIEAFVVAFILALLFRAFLAEAFVIPTGSMAPTLMGAHKDIFCDACDCNFRIGASRENSSRGHNHTVIGGVCPNCRHVNSLDLAGDANDATFNGDRILVNKFSYALSEPQRWDVIVFKYPGNPKQNYIKRLVGLPNETLSVRHGDVYGRPTGSTDRSTIFRKPPSTLLAMSHLVHDTDYQPSVLAKAGAPCRWQAWAEGSKVPPTDSWVTQWGDGGFRATVDAPNSTKWMRYFHRFPSEQQWEVALGGGSLASMDPYESRAITDFHGYDSYIYVPTGSVYADKPAGFRQKMIGATSGVTFNPNYQSGASIDQFGTQATWGGQDRYRQKLGRDGFHWVGDLIVRADVETDSRASSLTLELIEAGAQYRCTLNLSTGKATLSIVAAAGKKQGQSIPGLAQRFNASEGNPTPNLSPTASTAVLAGTRHTLRFSNCDDQLLLWVDDEVVTFDSPTQFDSRTFRSNAQDRPHATKDHPLDGAPVAIGITGGKATVRAISLHRDKYYISTNNANSGISDYDVSKITEATGQRRLFASIQKVMATPDQWETFSGWEARREVTFELQEDQFFPMGDNSPESLDARCWAGVKSRIPMPGGVNRDAWRWSDESYVPRDLLVGRAIVVFWPHSWNDPVPMLPNFKRMKLIR